MLSVKLAVANDTTIGSNSLPMLAAIIRAEHAATARARSSRASSTRWCAAMR
jgi:hypothetical protein